jgi:hypothetical protein
VAPNELNIALLARSGYGAGGDADGEAVPGDAGHDLGDEVDGPLRLKWGRRGGGISVVEIALDVPLRAAGPAVRCAGAKRELPRRAELCCLRLRAPPRRLRSQTGGGGEIAGDRHGRAESYTVAGLRANAIQGPTGIPSQR